MIFGGALLFSCGLTLAVSPLTALVAGLVALSEDGNPWIIPGAIVLLMTLGLTFLVVGAVQYRAQYQPGERPLRGANLLQ
ncbi:MAG: hypothetical protein OXC98_14050 [bacterium]|nr:hypothetical protein [Acidimicrobiia bacterium]MCY4651457.1 hypothetical protein [bacterium]